MELTLTVLQGSLQLQVYSHLCATPTRYSKKKIVEFYGSVHKLKP